MAALAVSGQQRIKVALMLTTLAGMVKLVALLVSVDAPLHPAKAKFAEGSADRLTRVPAT